MNEEEARQVNQNNASAQTSTFPLVTKRAAAIYKKLSPTDRQLIMALIKSLSLQKE